jgi:hypothetical protein
MKLYIENYDISKLKKTMKNLDKYYKKTEKYTEIFLEEGIYTIDESSIYKLTDIQDVAIEHIDHLFNNYSILIDKSKFAREKVFQVPYVNTQISIERNIVEFTYSINNSSLKLIVKGVYENNVFNNNNENKYHSFSPIDFYFTDTDFIIHDLNVFLLVLTNLL